MLHKVRWTAEKIKQRLRLIEPLVYRRRHTLDPFRYTTLDGPMEAPPVGLDVDDGGGSSNHGRRTSNARLSS